MTTRTTPADAIADEALRSWKARPYSLSGLVLLPRCPACECAVGAHEEDGCHAESETDPTQTCSCAQPYSRLLAGVRVC